MSRNRPDGDFVTCVRCDLTKELVKTPEFCPNCGGYMKPIVVKQEYASSEKKEATIMPSKLTGTWKKKIKHKRKRGGGQYFKGGSYAV